MEIITQGVNDAGHTAKAHKHEQPARKPDGPRQEGVAGLLPPQHALQTHKLSLTQKMSVQKLQYLTK